VQAADDEVPAVRLMMEDEPLPEDASGAPVVRLRRERDAASDADSVYRYDRLALIAALASHARRRGR
jgi:two-component system chemotaxis sensor kinase CheA